MYKKYKQNIFENRANKNRRFIFLSDLPEDLESYLLCAAAFNKAALLVSSTEQRRSRIAINMKKSSEIVCSLVY